VEIHVSGLQAPAPGVYRRHGAETTVLYGVVREDLETLCGAMGIDIAMTSNLATIA
jgi:hypothetical protein